MITTDTYYRCKTKGEPMNSTDDGLNLPLSLRVYPVGKKWKAEVTVTAGDKLIEEINSFIIWDAPSGIATDLVYRNVYSATGRTIDSAVQRALAPVYGALNTRIVGEVRAAHKEIQSVWVDLSAPASEEDSEDGTES